MKHADEIKTYNDFNDYYADANALVRTKNKDFHVFRFNEIGDGIVSRMGPFRKNYYHFALARVLSAKVGVFDTHTVTEKYSMVVYLPGQIIHWEKTGDYNEIISLHAKTLLSSTDTGIKELAWSLNFDDYSHFMKFFKKMSGVTPAEFRKQVKG